MPRILNYMVLALHLLQLTTFWLICIIVNILNVLFWLECRHGCVCATAWSCNDIVNNALLCSIDGSIKCTTFISRVCLSLYQSFHLFSASIMSKQLYISSNFSHRLVNTPLYTVFHKIGTPSYFCNNFFKCWSIWMKITSLYSIGNLLSGDVVCNCIFYKYSLYSVIYNCSYKM